VGVFSLLREVSLEILNFAGNEIFQQVTPLFLRFKALRSVAQIPFRSLKRILDHSRVRFTANLKLALGAQTLGLRPFRFTENG
jgi:hypothetical protein